MKTVLQDYRKIEARYQSELEKNGRRNPRPSSPEALKRKRAKYNRFKTRSPDRYKIKLKINQRLYQARRDSEDYEYLEFITGRDIAPWLSHHGVCNMRTLSKIIHKIPRANMHMNLYHVEDIKKAILAEKNYRIRNGRASHLKTIETYQKWEQELGLTDKKQLKLFGEQTSLEQTSLEQSGSRDQMASYSADEMCILKATIHNLTLMGKIGTGISLRLIKMSKNILKEKIEEEEKKAEAEAEGEIPAFEI